MSGWISSKRIGRYEAEKLLGQYLDPSTITLEDWLIQWLESYKSTTVEAKTYDEYERLIINHIIPSLGKIKLQDLRTINIMNFINSKLKGGRLDGKPGGLSPTSIRRMHLILKMALDKAVDEDLITKNPAKACTLPKIVKSKPPVLSKEDYTKLINFNSGHRYSLAFNLLLATGLRKGELRALKWDDIDFVRGEIKVNHSYSSIINRDINDKATYIDKLKAPKTEESIRTVQVPPEMMNKLKEHKKNQLEEIVAGGSDYQRNNLVFCTRLGTIISSRNLNRDWEKFIKAADIEHIKLHGTRHSFATYLLEENVPRDTIKKILGHAEKSNTIDIYSHPSIESEINASKKIGILLKNSDQIQENEAAYNENLLKTS